MFRVSGAYGGETGFVAAFSGSRERMAARREGGFVAAVVFGSRGTYGGETDHPYSAPRRRRAGGLAAAAPDDGVSLTKRSFQ